MPLLRRTGTKRVVSCCLGFGVILMTLYVLDTSLPFRSSSDSTAEKMWKIDHGHLLIVNDRIRSTQVVTKLRKRHEKHKIKIIATQDPMVTTKYFTYVEDFLANWDKLPIDSEEIHRVKDVRASAMRLKNRKLFTQVMSNDQRRVVYELLANFDALAKKVDIRYFAYGGTLLGSFRHHDLVPYDDDVDIIIDNRDREKLKTAIATEQSSFLMSTLSPDHFKLYKKSGTFTNLYHDWTYPYIDISFYTLNSTHLRDMAMTYGRWWEYPLEIIFPLHNRPFGPLMIPSPKDTYKYLMDTYDLTQCTESYYSHELEMVVRCRMVSTDCEKLPYAFVYRSRAEGSGVNETLMKNGVILHYKIVNEPDYQAHIKNPYTLSFL